MSDTNNNPAPAPAPGQEPLDLAAIEARLKAATPGPWGYKAGFLKHYVFSLDAQEDFGISLQELHWNDGHEVPAAANAQFIANAPTDIAALISEMKRLREVEKVSDRIYDMYKQVMAAFPQCPEHGECIPYALEWLDELKKSQVKLAGRFHPRPFPEEEE
jgi:hypothetical protein